MNELEKEAYDIIKNPKKYTENLQFYCLYQKRKYFIVRFDDCKSFGSFSIVFFLNSEKELEKILIYDFSINLDIVVEVSETKEKKQKFEELWIEYIRKYHLRFKLMFV